MVQSIQANKERSRLKSICIEGYKSIASRENKQKISFGKISIILGANGSGKSNLISFFKMLNNMMTDALQVYIGKEGSAKSLLHYGSKTTEAIKSTLEFVNDKKDTDLYSFSLANAANDTLIFTDESVQWNDGQSKSLGSGQKESLLCKEKTNTPYDKVEVVIKQILSRCRVFQFHDTSAAAHIRSAGTLDNNRYLYSDGRNLAAYLYMLKSKSEYEKYYQRIVSSIKYVFPAFDDFVLKPQELNNHYIMLNWKEKGEDEYIFGAHQISDGSLRFMALATLLLQPPDKLHSVIIIDEPELGLHPEAISALAGMIRTANEYSQIILATQSPRLVDEFDIENIIITERDKTGRHTVFKNLNPENFKIWMDNYCLSQMWEKNILNGQP